MNHCTTVIFEKQLKEFGDKLPADKKAPIEEALAELKTANASQGIPAIDAATEKPNTVFQAASQEMYNAQAQAKSGQPCQPGGQPGPDAGAQQQAGAQDEVTDVDFEEVK